jgi:hypothetical protein
MSHARGFRGNERLVNRFLGDVEVSELANQRGEDTAGFGAVDLVDDASDFRALRLHPGFHSRILDDAGTTGGCAAFLPCEVGYSGWK